MSTKILEITLTTKSRLGFYNEFPNNPEGVEGVVKKWYVKEGETVPIIRDPNTGTEKGGPILTFNSVKGEKEIEAADWEIGARVTKILRPEGEEFYYDLRKGPLQLAEMEPQNERLLKEVDDVSGSNASMPPMERPIRLSPLARACAEEKGIPITELTDHFRGKASDEITLEQVEAYARERPAKTETHVPFGKTKATSDILAAPCTRKRARELGIDIAIIPGTGKNGVVTIKDVEMFSAQHKQECRIVSDERKETVHEAPSAVYEIVRPSILKKTTAAYMAKSWRSPHAGPEIDIDPGKLLRLREDMKEPFKALHGVSLRIDHFVAKASAYLLSQEEFKILNAYWHEDGRQKEIRLYRNVNIGISVAIPADPKAGRRFSELVTPSIKNADTLSLPLIAREADRVIAEALSGHPKMEDVLGTTFIVNNTGAPVEVACLGKKFPGDERPHSIFAPETAAILSFGTARSVPGSERQCMCLALRFDHQVCNGREPIAFIRALQYLLEHPEQILCL